MGLVMPTVRRYVRRYRSLSLSNQGCPVYMCSLGWYNGVCVSCVCVWCVRVCVYCMYMHMYHLMYSMYMHMYSIMYSMYMYMYSISTVCACISTVLCTVCTCICTVLCDNLCSAYVRTTVRCFCSM